MLMKARSRTRECLTDVIFRFGVGVNIEVDSLAYTSSGVVVEDDWKVAVVDAVGQTG